MRRSHTFVATALGTLGLLAGGVALAQQNNSNAVDEIVVTAQKRTEALAEVPMSVTVLSGDALARQQADNFQDFVALVPGFSLNTSRRGVSRVTLRGINTGGVASTVGVYVNDVPFGSSSGLANAAILSGDFDTFDLARLEVLRGPQGTLYGASSLGGVMKYVTNAPDPSGFAARGKASLESVRDGEIGHALTGVVNLPLSERAALRASGFYRHDGGYIDSIGNNPIASLSDPNVIIVNGTRVEEDFNGVDSLGGRLAALFELSEDVSLELGIHAQNVDSDSSNLVDGDPVTLTPASGEFVGSRYHADETDIEYRVYSAALDWDFGGFTLQSITSYGTFEQDFRTDLAANTALAGAPLAGVATLFFGDAATRPLSVALDQVTYTDKFTQEFRLVSDENDTFEWLVGLYFTNEDSGIDPQNIVALEAGTDTIAADIPALAEARLVSDFEEMALFVNTTWHLSDRFELSLGARASENDQTASQTLQGALVGGAVNFDDANSSESPFTWSFSPRFEVNENLSVYGRVATGYRPGGPNVIPNAAPPGTPGSYDSDTLTSYEVGVKANSADGRFAIDAAAYFLDWEDVQLLAVVNGIGLNANGGTAESRGVEFAASFRPTEELSFELNGAYTDAELTQDTDPVVGGADGDPLSFVPEWSYGADGSYDWTLANGAMAYVGAGLAYVGERPAGFSNRDANGNIRELDGYTMLNLRAGIDFERWSLEVYARNATDEFAYSDLEAEGTLPAGLVGLGRIRPRTIGVSVSTGF